MEFAEDHWRGSRSMRNRRAWSFLSTPFPSRPSFSWNAWACWHGKLRRGAEQQDVAGAYGGHRKPMFLSTGMSPFSEIDKRRCDIAIQILSNCDSSVYVRVSHTAGKAWFEICSGNTGSAIVAPLAFRPFGYYLFWACRCHPRSRRA